MSSLVRKNLNQLKPPSIADQIMLAGLLQTLRHIKYKPKTLVEEFEWNYAIKYMREQCPELVGRKSYHAALEEQERRLSQVESGDLAWLHHILYKFSKKGFPFEKAPGLLELVQQYEEVYKRERNPQKLLGLQATIVLYCSINLKHDGKMDREILLNNPSLSKAVIALDKNNLLSKKMYEQLFHEKRFNHIHHDAIHALSEMQLLTPPFPEQISSPPLDILINKNEDYAKGVVILYDVHCLIQGTQKRIEGFKPTPKEKEKLQKLINSLQELKKELEEDLFKGREPSFINDKYTKFVEPFHNYIDFARNSKSNIFNRIAIAVINLIYQIWNYGLDAGPTRTQIADKLVSVQNRFSIFSNSKEQPVLPREDATQIPPPGSQ